MGGTGHLGVGKQLTMKFTFSKTLNSILVPSILCIIPQDLLESD